MKHKVCISVDEETLILLRASIRSGKYRNRSHAFEQSFLDAIEAEA